MFKKEITSEINALLEKYQFRRFGSLWNRECGDFVDVIDFQVGKLQETFTINVGITEKSVLYRCWGLDSLDVVDEASCTVRSRLGFLIGDRDVWWSLSNNENIGEVLNGIENMAIPFLQLNHSIDQMIEWLEHKSSGKCYPPESIYLALLYGQRGEIDRSRELLRALHAKTSGGWRQKLCEILHDLN